MHYFRLWSSIPVALAAFTRVSAWPTAQSLQEDPLPTPGSGPFSTPAPYIGKRQDQQAVTNPEDLSFIQNWAAVGDSYASGLGSGQRLSGFPSADWWCSRYDSSYPSIINEDESLGDPSKRKFTYWACSGATIPKTIDQLNALDDRSQDIITITAGGNDASFIDVLNECVYQWSPHSNAFTDACHNQIAKTHDYIHGPDFANQVSGLIAVARNKAKTSGTSLDPLSRV